MKARDKLDARIDVLRAEVQLAMRKRSAICNSYVSDVLSFLQMNSQLSFSPAEIMDATGCGEAAVRKMLTRLCRAKKIERLGHAAYRSST